MVASAGTTTGEWEIVEYEAKMFFGLIEVLGDPATLPSNNIVAGAVVESACLHTRILIDLLLSKNSGWSDDIRLDQLVPGFLSTSLDRLRAAYGNAKTEWSPCWTLNKMIAHPTGKRDTHYDYTSIIRQLFPLIKEVWQDVRRHHLAVSAKLPEPPGAIAPKFCARTSS